MASNRKRKWLGYEMAISDNLGKIKSEKKDCSMIQTITSRLENSHEISS